jgi:hypothetical protein
LLTTICAGEDFTDMESFGKERKNRLKDFLDETATLEKDHGRIESRRYYNRLN